MKMNRITGIVAAALVAITLAGCISAPKAAPTTVEDVSYDELADKALMEQNDNRLVRVTVQYLGPDVALIPQQALFADIADRIMINHSPVGFDYESELTSSTDTFLVGFPGTNKYSQLVESGLAIGDVITITGVTKYVNAGFGAFRHLLVEVRSVERTE